jgi:16S rRNA (uracil1498-N3)-methyltransferase
VIQIKNKGPEAFRDRWQKIADQALKQCGRLNRMEVSLPISLEDLLSQSSEESSHLRLWCDEAGTSESPYILNVLQENSSAPADSKKPWRLLVGPEGGWSHLERELLLKESQLSSGGRISIRVHLGSLILRAETAALFGISLMASIQRSKENNS